MAESTSDFTDCNQPFIVVLTGGIASGKTLVSELFSELGVPVVDTDIIARQIVEPGTPALAQIEETFGAEFILPSGSLDRERLRNEIFTSQISRDALESILHPIIKSQVLVKVYEFDNPYCIVVVPLFVEKPEFLKADFVLVVDTDEQLQMSRLMERDSVDFKFAQKILSTQTSRDKRIAAANFVISNNGTPREVKIQVRKAHQEIMSAIQEKKSLPTNPEIPESSSSTGDSK